MNPRHTYEEAVVLLCDHARWAWTTPWWSLAELIVSTAGRSWSVKDVTKLIPENAELLGCTGAALDGTLRCVFWDLDCGRHGGMKAGERQSYSDLAAALADARRLRDAFRGRCEIRLSKSGRGVHVRHLAALSGADKLPAAAGPKIAKHWAAKLGLKADPTPMGRQAYWLWARQGPARAFELIEPHEGLNL